MTQPDISSCPIMTRQIDFDQDDDEEPETDKFTQSKPENQMIPEHNIIFKPATNALFGNIGNKELPGLTLSPFRKASSGAESTPVSQKLQNMKWVR